MTTSRKEPTDVRWIVLALLCLASFVAYILRINMSIAGEAMMRDLGFSELQLGMVLSGAALGYGLFQLPGGLFGQALGPRKALAILMLGWGILTLVTGLVPGTPAVPAALSLALLVGLRFAIGATQAPLYPISGGISIVDWFPTSSWAFTNGLLTTSLTLGAAAAGPGVAWLAASLGWRQSFLALAPLGALMAALWWWVYRDDPADHERVNRAEIELIRAGRRDAGAPPVSGSWKRTLQHRDVFLITASYFCMNYVFYLFFNWFFYYLVEVRGIPRQIGGYLTGAQWIVGSVAATLGGWLCDRLSVRLGPSAGCRLTVMGGLLTCAPLLVAGAIVANPIAAVTLLSLSFGATQLTDGAYWAAAMRIGGRDAAAVTGFMNTGGNVVGGIGALLVPLVARSFGWMAAVGTGALFAVIAAGLWIWIRAGLPEES